MKWKNVLTAAVILFCVFVVFVIVKAYMDGKFESVETLQEYIKGFGLFAPLVLIAIQALQVVIPVLPGFLGCAVGAVLFGSMGGFWCNYIGISAGSIIAFLLAKKCFPRINMKNIPVGREKANPISPFCFWAWRCRCSRTISFAIFRD